MNKLHERALRLVYDDRQLQFEELLNKDRPVIIHHRNLQVLATELYNVHHRLAPGIMNNIFQIRNVTSNLRNDFSLPLTLLTIFLKNNVTWSKNMGSFS